MHEQIDGRQAHEVLTEQFRIILAGRELRQVVPFVKSEDTGCWTATVAHDDRLLLATLPGYEWSTSDLELWPDRLRSEVEIASYARNGLSLFTRPIYKIAPTFLQSEARSVYFPLLLRTPDADIRSTLYGIWKDPNKNILDEVDSAVFDERTFLRMMGNCIPSEVARFVKAGFRPPPALGELLKVTVVGGNLHIFLDNFIGTTMIPHYNVREHLDDIRLEVNMMYDVLLQIVAANFGPYDFSQNLAFNEQAFSRHNNPDRAPGYLNQLVDTTMMIIQERKKPVRFVPPPTS